jgi:hypothetical protein
VTIANTLLVVSIECISVEHTPQSSLIAFSTIYVRLRARGIGRGSPTRMAPMVVP